jgi:hypothetical protein
MTAPAEILAIVEPLGHTVESDPPAALTAVQRWTCTTCGDAILRNGGITYGGATERTCEQSQRFWANVTGGVS